MAQKFRGNQTPQSYAAGQLKNKPLSSTSLTSRNPTAPSLTSRNPTAPSLTSPRPTAPSLMQNSFSKFSGGSGPSSMGDLEAASMRLADAASRRNIAESQAQARAQADISAQQARTQADISAQQGGFKDLKDMSEYLRKKRRKAVYF
jgi:hypothetical protein